MRLLLTSTETSRTSTAFGTQHQVRLAWVETGWDGMEWDGMEWDETERDGGYGMMSAIHTRTHTCTGRWQMKRQNGGVLGRGSR